MSNFWTQTYNQGKNVASTIKKNVWDYATGQINEIKAIPSQISSGIDTLQKGARDLNYQAWNAWMKWLTGQNNATFSDIAPQISSSLSEKHGEHDLQKVTKVVEQLKSQWLNEQQIRDTIDEVNRQDPNFFRTNTYWDKIRQSVLERGREFWKTYNDFSQGKIGFGEATLRNAGDILWLGGGVIWNTITQIPWVEAWLQAVGKGIAAIPWVKPWMEAYGEFAKNNPRFAENAQAVANIWLTALGSTEGQKLISKWVDTAKNEIWKVTKPIKNTISNEIQSISNKLSPIFSEKKKSIIQNTWKLYGLENQEIGALKNVGEENTKKIIEKMSQLDEQALSWGGVGNIYDDLHGNIMKWVEWKSKQLSDLEKARSSIVSNSDSTFSQKELSDIFDKAIENQGVKRVWDKYTIVWEWRITDADISKLSQLRSDILRWNKKTISAIDMDARVKNLQKNLYNKDGTPVLWSESVSKTWEWIVAELNNLLKSKLPKEYAANKSLQSEIINTRKFILKKLWEEDNTIANFTQSQIENMTDTQFNQIMNDALAGNKMALFLRRLASSTTTGGDAKQLANTIKKFTGIDVESQAIALRAIAKLTGKNQIYNELGGLLNQWPVQGAINLGKRVIKKVALPSDETVLKAVSRIKPIIKKK